MRFIEAVQEYEAARFALYANLSECIDIVRRYGDPDLLPASVKNLTMGDAAERLIKDGESGLIRRILEDADRICDAM